MKLEDAATQDAIDSAPTRLDASARSKDSMTADHDSVLETSTTRGERQQATAVKSIHGVCLDIIPVQEPTAENREGCAAASLIAGKQQEGDAISWDIQPIPTSLVGTERNQSASANHHPGAYHVGHDATSARRNHNQQQANAAESSSNNSASSSDSRATGQLIEAHLVESNNDGEIIVAERMTSEVVVAERMTSEKAEEPAATTSHRTYAPAAAALCAIVLVLIVITMIMAIMLLQGGSGEDLLMLENQEIPNVEDIVWLEGQETPNPASGDGTDDDSAEHPCFVSLEELMDAVDEYYLDDSSTSTVATLYGWPIGTWCVSNLRKFAHLFQTTRSRSPKYSSPSDIEALTQIAEQFSEDLGDWDMSNAYDVEEMLRGIQNMSLASGVQRWNVSNMISLKALFMDTHWVDQPDLSAWDVSNVQTLHQLFRWSNVERAGIANWNTSNVEDIGHLADGASLFQEDISGWDISAVTSMDKSFLEASTFNTDISNWNLSSLKILRNAFRSASNFNQAIGSWDVSNLVTMTSAFQVCTIVPLFADMEEDKLTYFVFLLLFF